MKPFKSETPCDTELGLHPEWLTGITVNGLQTVFFLLLRLFTDLPRPRYSTNQLKV